jgi:hypothetical protein
LSELFQCLAPELGVADLAGTKDITDTAIEEAISWKKEASQTQQSNPS